MTATRGPFRTVRMFGAPCGECGEPAYAMTVFCDHTTVTHLSAFMPLCVSIGARIEDNRRIREGIGANGYQD